MSMKLEQKVKKMNETLDAHKELIDALREDIVELQQGGELKPEPGLNVPAFPRVLRQLGLTPPGESEDEEKSA